jgi:hypothetical protein
VNASAAMKWWPPFLCFEVIPPVSPPLDFFLQGFQPAWRLKAEKRSPRYTTRWEEILVVK